MKHKNNLFFSALVLFFSFICLTPSLAQTVIWDESVDGDFPGKNSLSNTEFQPVQLVDGTNIIKGKISNSSSNASGTK